MRGGGAGGRESERSKREEEGRTRSLIPLRLSRDRGGYTSQFEVSPEGGEVLNKNFLQRASAPGSPRSMPLPIYTPPGRFLDVTQRSSNVALQLRDIQKPATKENIAIVTKSKNFRVYKRCLCFIFENDTSFTLFVK